MVASELAAFTANTVVMVGAVVSPGWSEVKVAADSSVANATFCVSFIVASTTFTI